MQYTLEQQGALKAIEGFIKGNNSIFILKGYAGTGKTTMISAILGIAEGCKKYCQLLAPTGRAAKILSQKTQEKATTIHKGIYELSYIKSVLGNEKEATEIKFKFPLKSRSNSYDTPPEFSLLIIDESSMISSRKSSSDLFQFGSGNLLEDVLTYANLDKGGKIIFIGDPAQLPPVGDPDSQALREEYFEEKKIKVESFELKKVIRQVSESTILSNSIKIRELLQTNVRTKLILDRKDEEVEDISCEEIPIEYCRISPKPSSDSPIVICYSNIQAASYNEVIRKHYFPENYNHIQVGDRLIIVGNNYSYEQRDILNGEFVTVVDFSAEVEKKTGPVYVKDEGDKKTRVNIDLFFRDVTLLFEDGTILPTKILENVLNSNKANISYEEYCALMCCFSMSHEHLKIDSAEYMEAMLRDPYYNALRVKYGYAITGHKAQGGEWETTFVDFSQRKGLSNDCLRWSYTAATRASKRMFGYSLHNIPELSAKIVEIKQVSQVSEEYYPKASIVPGPFHTDKDMPSVIAKYWQVADALEGTGYKVQNIERKPYREIYSISDSEGNTTCLHATYNKSGIFKPFQAPIVSKETHFVENLINNGEQIRIPFSYNPSNHYLLELYAKVSSLCDDLGIVITNIVEHLANYKVTYYLKTDAEFAYLEAFINKFGQVTYINPRSKDGGNDIKLISLINCLKEQ